MIRYTNRDELKEVPAPVLAVKRSRVPPIRSGLILHPEDQRVTMSKIVTLFFLPEDGGKQGKTGV
jgi:hypothetical protein